ncbi:MAG: PDZ domain-containing protein [Patescibacteria group bacterium]
MEQEAKKAKKGFKLFGVIVLIIVAGFVAGLSGEFIARYYLSNVAFFRDLYFTGSTNQTQGEIVINDPRKVVVEQDLRLSQIKNEIRPSVLNIYSRQKDNKNLLDNIFLPEDFLGQAIVLTSDGWLISNANVSLGSQTGVVIGENKKIYKIEKIIQDPASSINFIKINAQNLSVAKLADISKITDGEQLVAYNSFSNIFNLANISNGKYKEISSRYDYINSTQILDKAILLNKNLGSDFVSAPIFNFQSELIGFIYNSANTANKVIPINYIDPIINQVLKGEKITRPYLGINYIDLAQVDGLDETVRQGAINGALIWPNQKGIAIAADSPLTGKLVKGDIITSFENQALDANNNLNDLLLEYKSGQQVSIKYLHEQKAAEISIVLK